MDGSLRQIAIDGYFSLFIGFDSLNRLRDRLWQRCQRLFLNYFQFAGDQHKHGNPSDENRRDDHQWKKKEPQADYNNKVFQRKKRDANNGNPLAEKS